MKRPGLRFVASTALSLAASMTLAAMWGRSYRVCESFDWDRPAQKISIASHHGGVSIDRLAPANVNCRSPRLAFSRGAGYHAEPASATPAAPSVPPRWRLAGFSFTDGRVEDLAVQDVVVPYWFLVAVSAGITIASAERSSRRPPMGCCPACAYNLTGNVSGICPECGTAVVNML
jgi:hypothetical protein